MRYDWEKTANPHIWEPRVIFVCLFAWGECKLSTFIISNAVKPNRVWKTEINVFAHVLAPPFVFSLTIHRPPLGIQYHLSSLCAWHLLQLCPPHRLRISFLSEFSTRYHWTLSWHQLLPADWLLLWGVNVYWWTHSVGVLRGHASVNVANPAVWNVCSCCYNRVQYSRWEGTHTHTHTHLYRTIHVFFFNRK